MQDRKSILIIDDEFSVRSYLRGLLSTHYEILEAEHGDEALHIVRTKSVDLVLLDLMLELGDDGLTILKKLKMAREDLDVIIISGVKMVKTVVEAMDAGATDYINKPIDRDALFLAINRVLEKRIQTSNNQILEEKLKDQNDENEVIGVSEAVERIKSTISRLKGQEVNAFLVGETGTGKEVFSRLLHSQEKDPKRPFVSVNCAAIPENLLESVLFGHEKGSFTGATERRLGKFELANGGDIFLDEITCLPPDLQAKLLRVLEEREVERVGSSTPKKISFRVISASNDNILREVAEGRFRKDLFYRLNTVTIELPPLRERREDIIPLSEYFLKKYRRSPEVKALSEGAKEVLESYEWKGNVRELRNTIENMIIFSKGNEIQRNEVPVHRMAFQSPLEGHGVSGHVQEGLVGAKAVPRMPSSGSLDEIIGDFEKKILEFRLEKNRWSKTRTAKDLGITRNKLYRKLAEHDIAP